MADEENKPTVEEEGLFEGLKKKKKKKAVAFDNLDLPDKVADVPPPPPAEAPAADPVLHDDEPTDLPATTDADLDFSDLKRKKKKKVVDPDLEDAGGQEKSGMAIPVDSEEFADLKKKKKKGGKKDFDLEAFERELAEQEGANGVAPDGGSDDEHADVANEDVPEDGLFNREGEEAAAAGEKSKAQTAAERRGWLEEPDRDYTYDELLGRFYQALHISHPSLSAAGGGKKRYTLAPPSVHRDGSKRCVWANVVEICKKMHRQPEHVIQFLFAELGTSGSVDAQQNLVIKGRFQQKQIENVLRRYIVEYVTCKTCKSPDTLLDKDNRLYFVTCETCGSKRSVSAIKTGFSAQIGKRKAKRAG